MIAHSSHPEYIAHSLNPPAYTAQIVMEWNDKCLENGHLSGMTIESVVACSMEHLQIVIMVLWCLLVLLLCGRWATYDIDFDSIEMLCDLQ